MKYLTTWVRQFGSPAYHFFCQSCTRTFWFWRRIWFRTWAYDPCRSLQSLGSNYSWSPSKYFSFPLPNILRTITVTWSAGLFVQRLIINQLSSKEPNDDWRFVLGIFQQPADILEQRVSNAKGVSMSWRHYDNHWQVYCCMHIVALIPTFHHMFCSLNLSDNKTLVEILAWYQSNSISYYMAGL